MTTPLALVGALLIAASGFVAACARAAGPKRADRLGALALGSGAACCAVAAVRALAGGGDDLAFGAGQPLGALELGLDPLSAVFLLPVAVLTAACGCYSLGYFGAAEHPREAPRLRVSFGLACAGLVGVLLARHSLVFLGAWEVMAIGAFFAVTAEEREREVRDAGFLYLVSTRVSALCLLAMFGLLFAATGSLRLAPLASGAVAPGLQSAVFTLALVGFGLKAGFMPLHVWLPPTHAAAPTHVSALLSGVLIKSGIYGIVRVVSLLPDPSAWWGEALLMLGLISAVLGVALALAQHDLKRLLAYHSIENIGIIAIGLGLALMARDAGRLDISALALAGALLHVVNHALFKGLLFLGAGAVIQQTGTRALDALGGVAKQMPRTALCFTVGAVAIVGLPPLNGFVSEWLIYSGLLRSIASGDGAIWVLAALAVPGLALTGGLALACFAKVVGVVFLGTPRQLGVERAREAPAEMLAPMGALAFLCAAIGVGAFALGAPLASAARIALAASSAHADAPFGALSLLALALLALVGAVGFGLRLRLAPAAIPRGPTWDCGYADPSARMQYSASSFAAILVRAFAFMLAPHVRMLRPAGLFPARSDFHSHVPDAVLDGLVLPTSRWLANLLGRLRVLQQGSVHAYLLYVWIALVALLAFSGASQ